MNSQLLIICAQKVDNSVEKQSSKTYVLHIASTEQRESEHYVDVNGAKATLKIRYGDFSEALLKVVSELEEVRDNINESSLILQLTGQVIQAKKFAANQNQVDMIEGYIDSCALIIPFPCPWIYHTPFEQIPDGFD